jgi:hypothetical protein
MIAMSGVALVAADFAAPIAPAMAQQRGSIAEIIVYGNDPCPRSTDDQVVVCARRPEAERYRIPKKYRDSGDRQQRESWANKAQALETVGATGINSCSAVGPAGYTGCLTQIIKEAREGRKEQAADETPPE